MSKLEQEARLLTALSKELGVLATLERFSLRNRDPNCTPVHLLVSDCRLSFDTPYAHNGADEQLAMQEHLSLMVAEGISELVEMVLDRQRKTVEEARKAVADFQNEDWRKQLSDAVKSSESSPSFGTDTVQDAAPQGQIADIAAGVDIFEDDEELETV